MFDTYRETTFSVFAGRADQMQIELMQRGRPRDAVAGFRAFALVACLSILAFWAPDGLAVEVPGLYTAEVVLDPNDPDAQNTAYRDALREVLVRITGSGAATDPEQLDLLFPNPARFVRQYRPGADDSLIVSLDGPAIERVLEQAGQPVWGADRPLTVVWLAVDWGLGDREIVAADDPDLLPGDRRIVERNRMMREQVQEVASLRGIPIVFPLLDLEDLQSIQFVDIWGGFDETLLEASARYEAPSVLVGRIRPNDLQPPRWTWYYEGQRFGWPGEIGAAIGQLADALAARDSIRGDQEVETVEVTISGVESVRAYGEVQRYMRELRVVENVTLKSAAADRLVYSAEVRGGAERLKGGLSNGSLFEAMPDDAFIDGGAFPYDGGLRGRRAFLQFRFRPPRVALPGSSAGPAAEEPLPVN